MTSKNAFATLTASGSNPLTFNELKDFKLGKLLGVVEDVFHEPEYIGRDAMTRPVQPGSYDFSLGNNFRVGWLRHADKWRMYAQSQKSLGSATLPKNQALMQAGNSVRHLVKKLQLFPKNVQDTAMYAFRSATVFIHWQSQEGASAYAAWLHPTKLSNVDWYYLGSASGLELELLETMRKGTIDLRNSSYMLL